MSSLNTLQSNHIGLIDISPRGGTPIPSTVSLLKEKLPTAMIISPSSLKVSVVIGQGEFGVIYKASLNRIGGDQEIVAVKTLKGIFTTHEDVEKSTKEILKMYRFDHRNVMSLIGVCLAPAEEGVVSAGPGIVMPFMSKGSLLDYLRREADNFFAVTEDEVSRVRKPLVQICQQIARGMEYLASLKFIHRDLAARNCLMDSDGTIKISDFGLSEDLYSRNYFRQAKDGAKFPLKWMALESIKFGVFSEKSDVWSYGVTCWEVFSGGAIPYSGIHPHDILDLLEEGERLSKPKNAACCDGMYGIMKSCWELNQESRPQFADIVQKIEAYLEVTSDYIDLTMFKDSNEEEKEPDRASLVKEDPNVTPSLKNRIPASPNDYCVAESPR